VARRKEVFIACESLESINSRVPQLIPTANIHRSRKRKRKKTPTGDSDHHPSHFPPSLYPLPPGDSVSFTPPLISRFDSCDITENPHNHNSRNTSPVMVFITSITADCSLPSGC
jgi:hypothetical protein